MKKTLMVVNNPICPVSNGSQQRVYNLVKLLEKIGCEVQIVISNNRVGYLTTIEQMPNKVYFFDSDRRKTLGAVKREEIRERLSVKALRIYSFPYRIDDIFPNGLDEFVEQLHKKEHYDHVIVEYVYMSKALTKLGNDVIKIVDTHDILSEREHMYYNMNVKPSTFYTNQKEERKGLMRADRIFAIQKEEAQYFHHLVRAKRKVLTIGNFFEANMSGEVVLEKNILFVGSNNDPNREALNYFLKSIWPKVKEKVPSAKFYIAGSISNSVESSEQYEKIGFLEDLSSAYKGARVVVNPMISGTGLPIKSIEAMAYGKPMVMTESGARGLYKEGKEPHSFLLAKNTNQFIDMLVDLLEDDDKVRIMQARCQRFVRKYNDNIIKNINLALSK